MPLVRGGDAQAPAEELLSDVGGKVVAATLAAAALLLLGVCIALALRTCRRDARGAEELIVNQYYGCLLLATALLLGPTVVLIVGVNMMFSVDDAAPMGDGRAAGALALVGAGFVGTIAALSCVGHTTLRMSVRAQSFTHTVRHFVVVPSDTTVAMQEMECFVLKTVMRRNKPVSQVQLRFVDGKVLPLERNFSTARAAKRQAFVNMLNDFLYHSRRSHSAPLMADHPGDTAAEPGLVTLHRVGEDQGSSGDHEVLRGVSLPRTDHPTAPVATSTSRR